MNEVILGWRGDGDYVAVEGCLGLYWGGEGRNGGMGKGVVGGL